MELSIKHPNGIQGGPTTLTDLEPNMKIAEVIALFKNSAKIDGSLRLKSGKRWLKSNDCHPSISGIVHAMILTSGATQALRRIERG